MEILEHCAKEDVTFKRKVYLDTLKPTYNILKLAGSSLGFKHSYYNIVLMKQRNHKNNTFLGREHSEEYKLNMYFHLVHLHLLNG